MDTLYIIRNQLGHYWGRGKRWTDGRDTGKVFAPGHRDEAVNTVFELSAKDVLLRCEVLDVTAFDGKLAKLEISDHPLPDAEEPEAEDNLEAAPTEALEKAETGPISGNDPESTKES